MAAVIPLPGRAQVELAEPAPRAPSPAQMADAVRRRTLAELVLMREQTGISRRKALEWVETMLLAGSLPQIALEAARELARGGSAPSRVSLGRWASDFKAGGLMALVADYKGRPLVPLGCEVRMAAMYQMPTQPAMSTVAYWLKHEGHDNVTAGKVRRRLKRMPSNMAETSPKRLGKHPYDQDIRPYQLLDWKDLPVGMMYVGDGHRCDVYVAHPNTGDPIRPELTLWMDRRSQYIVGAWLSYDENSRDAIYSLSQAIYTHRNVPGFIYTDPGSGFVNDDMSHPTDGFCARFSIEQIVTRAGNARAKGIIEGYFGSRFEERYGKTWGDAFCGDDRTDDAHHRLRNKIKKGELRLPQWEAYRAGAIAFIEQYQRDRTDALGCAPADFWAKRESCDPVLPQALMVRPRDRRIVGHSWVRHDGRLYRLDGGFGAQLEGREVIVEWEWSSDAKVWIYDVRTGAYICEASFAGRRPGMSESRIADAEVRREKGRVARKQRQIEMIKAQSRASITHDQHLDAIEAGLVSVESTNEKAGIEQSLDTGSVSSRPADTGLDITDTGGLEGFLPASQPQREFNDE